MSNNPSDIIPQIDKHKESQTPLSDKTEKKDLIKKTTQDVLNLKQDIKKKTEVDLVTKETTDSLSTLSKEMSDIENTENLEIPLRNFSLSKSILKGKFKMNGTVFEDFQSAKKILLHGKNPVIKEILNYPGADAFFFSIIKQESKGNMIRNSGSKTYYGYGQISKNAEHSVEQNLHKKFDRMKGVDNCTLLIGYIAICWEKLSPYVAEKDLSKFALMGFKGGVEGLRVKLKKLSSSGEKVSRKQYIKTYNKDRESYYVCDIRNSFNKLTMPESIHVNVDPIDKK